MILHITHPTKEQVRAYMAKRELARRPPPAPEEIRRRLGWRLDRPAADYPLAQLCLLPSAYGRLAAQLAQAALDWACAAARIPSLPRDRNGAS